MEHIKLFYK